MREFTKEETLLATLRGKYASQFAKRFGDMEPHIVDMIIKGALVGITDEQFNQGMARLLAPGNKFMPDIAEFQGWCVSGAWWSSVEAWQRACDYSNDPSLKITKLAKKAWDSVYYLVEQGSMKAAASEFKSIYNEYLAKAQIQGRQQEWYVPPVMLNAPKTIDVAPVHQMQKTSEQEQITSLTTQYMKDGMSYKAAFDKAQMEVRGTVKPMFKGVA